MTESGKRLQRLVAVARRIERMQADLRDLASAVAYEVAEARNAVLREEAAEQAMREPATSTSSVSWSVTR